MIVLTFHCDNYLKFSTFRRIWCNYVLSLVWKKNMKMVVECITGSFLGSLGDHCTGKKDVVNQVTKIPTKVNLGSQKYCVDAILACIDARLSQPSTFEAQNWFTVNWLGLVATRSILPCYNYKHCIVIIHVTLFFFCVEQDYKFTHSLYVRCSFG